MTLKVAWGITGSGDLMPETVAAMSALSETQDVEITAVLSKAAVKVVRWYKLTEQVESFAKAVLIEEDANTPFIVGKLQIGRFDCFVVAPATANSVAKIAHGIADTIITNAVAQTAKSVRRSTCFRWISAKGRRSPHVRAERGWSWRYARSTSPTHGRSRRWRASRCWLVPKRSQTP